MLKKKGLKDKLKIYKKSCTADLHIYIFLSQKKNIKLSVNYITPFISNKTTIYAFDPFYMFIGMLSIL